MDRDQVARIRVIIERRAAWANALYPGRRLPDSGLARRLPPAETACAPSCNRRHPPSAPITPSTPASRPRSPRAFGRPFDRGDEIASAASYTSICWSHDVTEFSAPTGPRRDLTCRPRAHRRAHRRCAKEHILTHGDVASTGVEDRIVDDCGGVDPQPGGVTVNAVAVQRVQAFLLDTLLHQPINRAFFADPTSATSQHDQSHP